MKFFRLACFVLFGYLSTQCGQKNSKMPKLVSLTTCNWQFSEKDSSQTYLANIPGSVHMDLLANNLIAEPYFGDNEKDLQWIGERDWNYQTTFVVSSELMDEQYINLCFDGLDTYADVYLNDSLLLSADNYFRTWKADVKHKLLLGDNTLQVRFKNSVGINKALRTKDTIPLFDDYVYTRKPAFHYGWDWGPIFITSGIWRPVYLKAWSNARIVDNHIIQEQVDSTLAVLRANVEIESRDTGDAQLSVQCDAANLNKTTNIKLKKGINTYSIPLEISNPKLWWSHGLGEAHLYTISVELSTKHTLLDEHETNIGVRTLKLVQNPDQDGSSFHFEINGVPVFAKGANYIPQESFQSKVDSSDYRKVIQHALDANMNMLRVWGGGFYEEDYFYDLCDENGILVWQDFMFACSMYPGEKSYLESVKQEAIENVKRLRNHASLALWCGNNENYIGWQDWRWSNKYSKEDSALVWHDYEQLFHRLLPDVIKQYDADKAYWPSSPKYGWGYPVNKDGDVHLWAVWHAQDPFEVFLEEENIGRFMSEYGFQSLPEMKTIKAFTKESDRDIESDVMKSHQKHRVGYPVIDKYIKRDYNWPKDFESYVYVSQVLQAKGIKMAIEAHRRAMPFCMGTLYWQLNDCWPVASWSSVDYYNRWKALHYKVRDAYADILISAVNSNGKTDVYIVSDRLKGFSGSLKMKVNKLSGEEVWSKKIDVQVPLNNSELIVSQTIQELLKGNAAEDVVLSLKLYQEGGIIASNEHYFTAPKDLNLLHPKVKFDIQQVNEYTYKIILESEVLAKDVCLTIDDVDGQLSDNYFDLLPGVTKAVMFDCEKHITIERNQLSIRSLIDSY